MLADGKPITEPGRDRMVMFQEPALFPWLDVMGNVLFGLKLKPGLNAKERREVAEFYLKLVGLERFMHAPIHELSGGMKQRVALARALAPNPRVLLMDEPFASLDALTREQLYGDIQEIWAARKKTILFVTHNVREAACLGNRVILFSPNPGRIREEFKIDLERPRDINSVQLAGYSIGNHARPERLRHSRRSQNETIYFVSAVFHHFALDLASPGAGESLVARVAARSNQRLGVS